MNWEQLLTSPPPATAWDLGENESLVVHRTGPGELHCAAEDVPSGAFEVGTVGLQAVHEDAVSPVLTRLKGAAEGTSTAAVVVPTGWMRSFLLEADKLPRKESEVHDVVRWRLKKLLPVAPTDLRLAVVRLPEVMGRRQVLVLAGIERAVASLESIFRAIGVEPGLITTRLFALVPRTPPSERPLMLIQLEPGFLSLLLLVDGIPRLLRTKLLSPGAASGDAIVRELKLDLEFIRDKIGVGDQIEVKLVCEDDASGAELKRWVAGQDDVVVLEAESLGLACGPSAVAGRLGAARLAPSLAVVAGEVR